MKKTTKQLLKEWNMTEDSVGYGGGSGFYEQRAPWEGVWDNPDDLLGSIVHSLEQDVNGTYSEIEKAFKPFIKQIHKSLIASLKKKYGL